tara:strand:+ start:59 stop:1726 length:1668 start_codon:yes stop_codon:yes gene_type:complete
MGPTKRVELLNNTEERYSICKWCRGYGDQNEEYLQSKTHYFRDFLSTDEENQILDRHQEICQLPVEKLCEWREQNIPIGRIVTFVVSRHFKINRFDSDIPENVINYFHDVFKSVLITFQAYQNFLVSKHKPEMVVCFNPLYPVNNVVWKLNEQYGVKNINIDGGDVENKQMSYFKFSSLANEQHYRSVYTYYMENKASIKLEPSGWQESLQKVRDHFTKGNSNVGSLARTSKLSDLRKRFSLDKYEKTILLSSSSLDECESIALATGYKDYMDCYNSIFHEMEWISKVIEYANSNPKTKLIIRLHPREFHGGLTQHAKNVLKLKTPQNVEIDSNPTESSIYDLLDLVDLVLITLSTVGWEAKLVGLPVITTFRSARLYPLSETDPQCETTYFDAIDNYLSQKKPRDLRYVEDILHFTQYQLSQPVISINDKNYWKHYPKRDQESLDWKKRRILHNLPVHLQSDYATNFSITELQSQRLLSYFNDGKDLIEWANEPNGNQKFREFFKKQGLKEFICSLFDLKNFNIEKLESLSLNGNKTASFYLESYLSLYSDRQK